MKKILLLLAAALVGACGSLPKSAPPITIYDFGLPAARLAADGQWSRLALEVKSPPWFDSLNIDYRLAYEDPLKPREYAGSRWAGTPGALLALRLRQQIGTVSAAGNTASDCLLRVELQEFSQIFDAPQQVRGVVQGGVSLIDGMRQVIAERQMTASSARPQVPMRTGGVGALVAASTEFGQQLADWLMRLDKDGLFKRCKRNGL